MDKKKKIITHIKVDKTIIIKEKNMNNYDLLSKYRPLAFILFLKRKHHRRHNHCYYYHHHDHHVYPHQYQKHGRMDGWTNCCQEIYKKKNMNERMN